MIEDPAAKIAEYIEHRSERERRLIEAMAQGERSRMALLAAVWDDVPREMLPMAAFAMQAHEEKLEEEGGCRTTWSNTTGMKVSCDAGWES